MGAQLDWSGLNSLKQLKTVYADHGLAKILRTVLDEGRVTVEAMEPGSPA